MNTEMGLFTSSNWLFEEGTVAKWTREENKSFENALALFDKDTPDRWFNVASMIPGKTVSDVIKQYRDLVDDISDIEAGLIPVPGYSSNFTFEWMSNHGLRQIYSPAGKRSSSSRCNEQERKKGIPWTEEEHRQFLLGLNKYGKGDWRNISRNFVTSRTPTQVASHAQKYFIRQLSGGKDKRRSSIHDITTVNLEETKSPSSDKEAEKFVQHPHQNLQDTDVAVHDSGGILMGFSHFQGGSSSFGINNLHENHHFQTFDPDGFRLGHQGTVFQMHR